jgi:hypothetical protein
MRRSAKFALPARGIGRVLDQALYGLKEGVEVAVDGGFDDGVCVVSK